MNDHQSIKNFSINNNNIDMFESKNIDFVYEQIVDKEIHSNI